MIDMEGALSQRDVEDMRRRAEEQSYPARRRALLTMGPREFAWIADPVEAPVPDTSGIDFHPERMSETELAQCRKEAQSVIDFTTRIQDPENVRSIPQEQRILPRSYYQ